MKSGFIAIIGRPNAGKSTLINSLVGEKIAIVSWRPQTTRNKILGVLNGEDFQAVFIDTPGLHQAKNALDDYMTKSIRTALDGVDAVLYVCDAVRGVSHEDLQKISDYSQNRKVIVAVNKIDSVTQETLAAELVKLTDTSASEVVPISAKRGDGVEQLSKILQNYLCGTEPIFPDDVLTDKSVKFMCAEYIREKALKLLDKEIPYGVGVLITEFAPRENSPVYDVSADIVCEKQSHKGIIIGKGGAMLKEIGAQARVDMEELLDCKVFLTLYVRVEADWRNKEKYLSEIGYIKSDL